MTNHATFKNLIGHILRVRTSKDTTTPPMQLNIRFANANDNDNAKSYKILNIKRGKGRGGPKILHLAEVDSVTNLTTSQLLIAASNVAKLQIEEIEFAGVTYDFSAENESIPKPSPEISDELYRLIDKFMNNQTTSPQIEFISPSSLPEGYNVTGIWNVVNARRLRGRKPQFEVILRSSTLDKEIKLRTYSDSGRISKINVLQQCNVLDKRKRQA